jgi:hypothetical protein
MLVLVRPARQAVAVALTEHEQAVLDFERSWWTVDGVKEVLIEERLGLTSSRYYQVLNELLDRPDALEHDPMVVRRLRRLRDRKRRARLDAAGGGSHPPDDRRQVEQ